MRFNLFGYPSVLGIDMTTESIALILLKKVRWQYQIVRAETVRFGYGQSLDILLYDFIKSFDVPSRTRCALSLPIDQLKVDKIKLPEGLSNAAIQTEIKFYLKRILNMNPDELHINFHLLPTLEMSYVDVYFVAVEKDRIAQYFSSLSQTGLRVSAIEPNIYGLHRAAHLSLGKLLNCQEDYAILAVTQQTAMFIVFNKEYIQFYQTWVPSSEEFLDQIKQKLMLWQTVSQGLLIKNLFICGTHSEFKTLDGDDLKPFLERFDVFDALSAFHWPENIDCHPMELLIAVGTALREFNL